MRPLHQQGGSQAPNAEREDKYRKGMLAMSKRHNDEEVWNCDVCGRLTNHQKDPGYHIHQGGGYACNPCHDYAEKYSVKCPTCGGNLAHGPYESKCSCHNPPRFTRSGRHHTIS